MLERSLENKAERDVEGGVQEMKQSLLHVSTLPSVPLFILITHINLLRIKK